MANYTTSISLSPGQRESAFSWGNRTGLKINTVTCSLAPSRVLDNFISVQEVSGIPVLRVENDEIADLLRAAEHGTATVFLTTAGTPGIRVHFNS